jgi:hypothetical protein
MASARGPTPSRTDTARAAAGAIAVYAPASLSAEAAGFARAVVARARPATPARAKALLFAAGRLARFGESVGLAPSPELLLRRALIERFVVAGATSAGSSTTASSQRQVLPAPVRD